jgi:micrococcal nuclease
MRVSRVAVCLLVLVAGCTALPGTSETSTPGGGEATVTRVVDGDTVEIASDGGPDTVRLLGVDTPERVGGTNPAEFEGVPNTTAGRTCLRAVAGEATTYLSDLLGDGPVRMAFDDASDRRDRYGRLLAYLSLPDGTNVNRALVADGYARVYDTAFAQSAAFYAAEAAAQENGTGVWRCRDPVANAGGAGPLALVGVHADAAGDDRQNLGDEYVVLGNSGEAALDLSGWTVRDRADHVYRVPEGVVLDPGETVTLYTGSGTDTGDALYWGADRPVWNNDGDVVVVTDGDREVLRESY